MYILLAVALRNGGRYVYLWISAIFHGLVVESLSYMLPDIDNFWHAQAMVMFLGKRLPLYVVLLCKYMCEVFMLFCLFFVHLFGVLLVSEVLFQSRCSYTILIFWKISNLLLYLSTGILCYVKLR
jgi:hypothetical protein